MLRERYPRIEPFAHGFLAVSPLHTVYWEECGNPAGKPILFLHGGPGSGIEPSHRCFFDPAVYRIILLDQRGCGKSRPFAELKENTTWDLVADIEKLRKDRKIDRWIVFGGSWGSTLAIAYAETWPKNTLGIILRGIFLGRKSELDWFNQSGANFLFPDEYEKYVAPIPPKERGDLVKAYYGRLTSNDKKIRLEAARAWSSWEGATLGIHFNADAFSAFTEDSHAEAVARIECHYFVNRCFFKTDNYLLENIGNIRKIPAVIIQGRYDVICPMESAWALHKAWPEARLEIVPDAGHAASEPSITDALVRATDEFRRFS